MAYTKKDHLIQRIENNYYNFKQSLSGVSRETLFESADRIAAVTEVYQYMTKVYEWDEEGEIDFFLLFSDPMTVVSDAWKSYRDEVAVDIDGAIYDIENDVLTEYPLENPADNYFVYISR